MKLDIISFFISMLQAIKFFVLEKISKPTTIEVITGIRGTWNLYKEFLQKPKIQVDVEMSNLVENNQKIFDFQLNISMLSPSSASTDVYFKRVFLLNNKEIAIEKLRFYRPTSTQVSCKAEIEIYFIEVAAPTREIDLDWAIEYRREDFTRLKLDEINLAAAIVSIGRQSFFALRDFKLAKGSRKSLTLIGRMYSSQNLDNRKNGIPTTGWYLCIDYGVGKIKKKIFVTKA
ncbi:MAG: hypothetical protein M3N42_08035 [Cyanobacteriota bacterium]|nr:hypothetical protein [Cyanobacteriota bacterium]